MMKRNVKFFTSTIIALGFLNIGWVIKDLNFDNSILPILFFALLAVVSESLSVVTGDNTAVSLGFAVSLAAIILFSPLQASMVIFMGSFFQVDYSDGEIKHLFNTSLHKRLFNSSAYMLGVLVTTWIYRYVNSFGWNIKFGELSIISIITAVIVYFTMHMLLFIPLFSMMQKKSFVESLSEQFWILRHLVALAPFGIIISFAYLNYGWFMVLLIFGPLMIARLSFIQYIDTKRMYFETIETLSTALDAKDEYTNGHSKRVSDYASEISKEMGLGKFQKELVLNAALLHDIGKIGISDEIIKKPGKLTLGELYEIKRHPEIGERIIGNIGFLKEVSKIIRHHHERYDGSGYPDSITGDKTPIESSILAVADAYDAMTSDRPYRDAMKSEIAVKIIQGESGKQFDPIIVEAFMRYIEKSTNNLSQTDERIN